MRKTGRRIFAFFLALLMVFGAGMNGLDSFVLAAGDDGGVSLTSDILYIHDMYPDNIPVAGVVANFYHADPTTEEGAGETPYTAEMTKMSDCTHGVRLPAGYEYVRFTYYGVNGDEIDVHTAYKFAGTSVENTADLLYVDYEAGERDCIFLGISGLRSYISKHPDGSVELIENKVLYFNMQGSGYQMFTGTDSEGDEYDYLKLYFRDYDGSLGGEVKHDTIGGVDRYYFEVTEKASMNEDCYYIIIPSGYGISTETKLSLVDARIGITGQENFAQVRFYYNPAVGSNMITPANLENNQPFWGVYQSKVTGKRTILFDNYLVSGEDNYAPQIRYYPDASGDMVWSGWNNLENLSQTVPELVTANQQLFCTWAYTVPEGTTKVQFRRSNYPSYVTDELEIPDTYDMPCYYAHRTDSNGLEGYWGTAYDVNTSADGHVEIQTGTYEKNIDAYYGTANFYDYYAQSEYYGKPANQPKSYATQGEILNFALSAFYERYDTDDNALAAKSIYFGSGGVQTSYKNGHHFHGFDEEGTATGRSVWSAALKNHIYGGLMDETLSADGSVTQVGVPSPLFNASWLRGSNKYGLAVGQVYSNVLFPFTKNADGYWEYDSSKEADAVLMKKDVNEGYYLEKTEKGVTNQNHTSYGFFPFDNGATAAANSIENRDDMFGMQMSIPFTLTEDKRITVKGRNGEAEPEDVTFSFTGDDDVWIYIDGQLVLDLGGIHDTAAGVINFTTGEIIYGDTNSSITTNIELDETTKTTRESFVENLDSSESHTLTIFYLERGLYDSNLKITFNFPQSSTLEVTNSVTIPEEINDIFKEALSHLGSFDYSIRNQVVAGASTPVESSAGYLSSGASADVTALCASADDNMNITMSKSDNGVITYTNALDTGLETDVSNWSEISGILGTINVENVDVSDYAYLRMEIESSVLSRGGGSLYIALVDQNGNVAGSWASAATYNEYSNSLYANETDIVRINLSSLSQVSGSSVFDNENVTGIMVGFRSNAVLRISSLQLYKDITEAASTGFQVEQNDISDYGSVQETDNGTSYVLSPADGAWYEHYNSTGAASKPMVVEAGRFPLADGQRAVFTDKFRFGSYIYLNQNTDSRIFSTEWSLTENGTSVAAGYLSSNRGNMSTVRNGSVSVLDNVPGTMVNDGRISINPNGTEELLNSDNPDSTAFVFRNYTDPDDTVSTPVALLVEYENVLRYGSITIEKRIALDSLTDAQIAAYTGTEYEFRLQFTNVAGRQLELQTGSSYLSLSATVKVDRIEMVDGVRYLVGTATIDGIPAGTEYQIREVQADGARLESIVIGESSVDEGSADAHDIVIPDGTVVSTDADYESALGEEQEPYVLAVAYASNQAYIFTNERQETFDFTVRKDWKTATGANTDGEDSDVYVWLQRSLDVGKTWTDMEKPENYTAPDAALDKADSRWIQKTGGDAHTVTYENLPVIVEGKTASYRVREYSVKGYTPIYSVETNGTYVVSNIPTDAVLYVQSGKMTALGEYLKAAAGIEGLTSEVRIANESGKDVTDNENLFAIKKDEESVTDISYNAPTTGSAVYTFDFTYTTDEIETSQTASIRVLFFAYAINDDIYVLDYGLPAELSDQNSKYNLFANDVYEIDENTDSSYKINAQTDMSQKNGDLTISDESGEFQTDTTSVRYTPKKFMDSVDTFTYTTTVYGTGNDSLQNEEIDPTNGVVMTANIKVMPANVVYYEDNFNNNVVEGKYTNTDLAAGIVYGGSYDVTIAEREFTQSIDQDEVYGHDSVYEGFYDDSLGSSTKLNAVATGTGMDYMNSATARFTFTGTGFEVVGRTDSKSTKIMYSVFKSNGTGYTFVKSGIIDTLYDDGDYEGDGYGENDTLYQIPVIRETSLEKGTYNVILQVTCRSYVQGEEGYFILDGIRIHNPLDEADTADYLATEKGTSVVNVREMVLGTSSLAEQGVFTLNPDKIPEGATAAIVSNSGTDTNLIALGATVTEILGQHSDVTNSMEDYLVVGPKNEVYLSKGNAVAFIAVADDTADKTMQIEAKAVNTRSNYKLEIPALVNVGSSGVQEITIATSTAMYYELDMSLCKDLGNNKYLVILTNTSDTDISLSNLKYKGFTFEYPTGQYEMPETVVIDEDTVTGMNSALKNVYTDITKDDTDDSVSTDNTVEVVSATFATRRAELGDAAYLNITLRDDTRSYKPVIYLYKNGELVDITDNETLIDQYTLNSVRSYMKPAAANEGEEETAEVYRVFKVKVMLDETSFNIGDTYFAVGASNGDTYCTEGTVKKAAIEITGASADEETDTNTEHEGKTQGSTAGNTAVAENTAAAETGSDNNMEETAPETQKTPAAVSAAPTISAASGAAVSYYSSFTSSAAKETVLAALSEDDIDESAAQTGTQDAGQEALPAAQTDSSNADEAGVMAEEPVSNAGTGAAAVGETGNESASDKISVNEEKPEPETETAQDASEDSEEESQGGFWEELWNGIKSFFSAVVNAIRDLFTNREE